MNISEHLSSFNRKERYWVVKNVFGSGVDRLSEQFRSKLQSLLQARLTEPLTEDAWWAVDYHFDWLVAALRLHASSSAARAVRVRDNLDGSIAGTQEDVDFVVCSGKDLILIEAKAFGHWSTRQLTSKIKRMAVVEREAAAIPHEKRVELHYVLASREAPSKKVLDLPWPSSAWSHGQLNWLPLKIDLEDDVIARVGRLDRTGRESVIRYGKKASLR